MKVAVVPGSFDPVHLGHLEVIRAAARLFDEVVVAVFSGSRKTNALFSVGERTEMLEAALAGTDTVTVRAFDGLVVDLAREAGATAIVKGLRAVSDFENELQMSQMNHTMAGIDTVFIPTSSQHSFIASRLIREVAGYGGDVSELVPPAVADRLAERSSA